MSDEPNKVDEILDELDLEGSAVETPTESMKSEQTSDGQNEESHRLEKLRQAGAITQEEFELLQAHYSSDGESTEDQSKGASSQSQDFGSPIVTSEGTDMNFGIIGVFEDVDTSKLTTSKAASRDVWDDVDVDFPSENDGGPGRTLIFWQVYNHSRKEIKLKHKHINFIGTDKIAYNRDKNPLKVRHFEPGWRTENWEDISPDTRVKYVSAIELPVELERVKIDGYCSDIHELPITDEMRFPNSDLPVTVDL